MARGKFVYNAITLELPKLVNFRRKLCEERWDNFSASRVHETIVIAEWYELKFSVPNISEAEAAPFWHWRSYARLGNEFAFAFDGNKTADTTLDGAAAAAQKVVPLTSTSGLSVGARYLLKEAAAAGDDYEIVTIASISDGVSITAEENLLSSYASGDVFRDLDYYPSVFLPEGGLAFTVSPPAKRHSFDITLVEVT